MSDKEMLLVLVERAQVAVGPDRDLDCRIWLIVGPQLGGEWHLRGDAPIRPAEIIQGRWLGSALEKWPEPENVRQTAANYHVPKFTASLDAAMTLCEPHWWVNMSAPLSPDAYGYSREDQRRPRAGMECIGEPYSSGGHGATLPLAVTAMALRARALSPA
ncbi:hypothetical protein [Sphingomonas xinjiangensis]|uniref:Uncharacterized protein n=1 Tax=Sphingomonas xinjiangensis TaxID=643568 RepID=A0A840YK11_9SPHN|nr:hypothetical protein [Sphingomonas xinjiangensis]MBB5709366.1 hypothetical protein [Sphingomonas xinjiangensis]